MGAGGKRQQGGSKKTVRRMGGKAKGQRLGPAEVTQEGGLLGFGRLAWALHISSFGRADPSTGVQ